LAILQRVWDDLKKLCVEMATLKLAYCFYLGDIMFRNPDEDRLGGQSSLLTDKGLYTSNAFPTQTRPAEFDEYQSFSSKPPFQHFLENASRSSASELDITGWMSREPLLTSVIIVSILIMLYELVVIVTRPSWAAMATDWVRASLSWLEALPVLLAGVILYRRRRPGALAWLMFAAAMLSYATAQTTWAVLDRIIEPNNVPVPSQADLFYLIQYPFFFLGLALLPGLLRQGRPSIARAKVVLDSLLLMAAGTALSWYFILAPFYLQSGQSILGKATNMAYPVGDLGLLFGLTVVVISQDRRQVGQTALRIFIAAVIFLIAADSIFLNQELYPNFNPGDIANGCWIASYLLFALAGLVRFRAVQCEAKRANTEESVVPLGSEAAQETRDARGFQSLIPFLAAVVASALIVFRAATAPTAAIGNNNLIIPFLVSLGLLVLIGVRQGITVLENERLLRNEQRRTRELDQAKQMAEKQRLLLAERNQRLQVDIQVLKDIHARVARGDYTARVPINGGELLPIAGSLNIMLDRLSKLIRASSEYARLEQAVQHMVVVAHGIAEGNEQALSNLAAPSNTVLDGVFIALRQISTRINDMENSLQKLEYARKEAYELSEFTTQQSHSIADEGIALSTFAATLNQLATELERIIRMLERTLKGSPSNSPMVQLVSYLRGLLETIRQQHSEIGMQVMHFNQIETRTNQASIGSRRLFNELDTATRKGRNQMTTPNSSQRSESLLRTSASK